MWFKICGQKRFRWDSGASSTLSMSGLPLRVWWLKRYNFRRTPSTLTDMDSLSVLNGLKSFDAPNRRWTRLEQGWCAADDKPTTNGHRGEETWGILVRWGWMWRALPNCRLQGSASTSQKKGRLGRSRRLKAKPGRGTLAKEKPPIFGMIQRGGEVVVQMLSNVKQMTIAPLIKNTISPTTLIYTDEYNIYTRLSEWGYSHKTVNHGQGEYARDEDGDGFYEVHVNTIEGFWSLLRSWLRPHRGISQHKLPLYLGFFEFIYNVRKRGKTLLPSLLECLLN